MNLAKMALTTSLYQRFKKQKIGGRYYPWFKPYKYETSEDQVDVALRRSAPKKRRPGIIYSTRDTFLKLKKEVEASESPLLPPTPQRRRSSDFYLQPTDSLVAPGLRETSIVGGPDRSVFRYVDEVDLPKRIYDIKALPEDDMAGKTISFLWWFTFLVARMVSISSFAYFYTTTTVWLLSSHFVFAVSLLLYDAPADEIRRTKAIFFVFVGAIYMFCLVEFKLKFKKVKFWYYWFFTVVYAENFAMCLTWWIANVELLYNDWWFRYIFYLVFGSSVLSLSSLLFYVKINKPQSVVIAREIP